MAIERIKVRAKVEIGNLNVVTPFVQAFNVRKQRGQISSFDATLKVSHDEVGGAITGDAVKIYAGVDAANDLIFTGICRSAKMSPCYDDPKYVLLSISGADILSLLQGKKYTRRCRSSKSTWMAITGVIREGLKSGKFTAETNTIIVEEGKAFTDDNRVGHIGMTPATERNKSPDPELSRRVESAMIDVQILNDAPGA